MSTHTGSNESDEKSQVKIKKDKKDFGKVKTLDLETAKLFHNIKEKVNKKDFGKPVLDSHILKVAISLITADHIKELQENSLTAQDKIKQAHHEYIKHNGKISLDDYLLKLLKKEV